MSGDKLAHENLQRLSLSVGALVEFSARSGDLFAEMPFGPSSQQGIAGHLKVQKSRDQNWQAEYRLKQTLNVKEFQLTLQGRVDLLNESQQSVIIEEIKTSFTVPANIPPQQKSLHWAQVKVYAYLYCLEKQDSSLIEANGLPHEDPIETQITTRISWLDLTTNQLHSEQQNFTFAQLEAFTLDLVDIYLDWQRAFNAHRVKIVDSAKQLEFPFAEYRRGQHNFARLVYQTVKNKQQLLVEAPTGTGKTMSTLFPLVKATGESVIEQIIYLTAKGSAQETARNTLALLRNSGLIIDSLTIQAKDKACPCRSSEVSVQQSCNNGSGKCSRTLGFFDRLPEARKACLAAKNLDTPTLQAIATTHQLCPFELSLQMIRWSTVVICDFNYVLDPMVKLAVFDENKNRRALLIDEIHNLPERAKAMYSARLSAAETKAIAHQLSDYPVLKKSVLRLARNINLLTDENDHWPEKPKSIDKALSQLLEIIGTTELDSGFGSGLVNHQVDGFNDWLKALYRYKVISELYNDSHIAFATNEHRQSHHSNEFKQAKHTKQFKNVDLHLMCLHAAEFLASKYQSARAVIGFSATLSPLDFYRQMLGFAESSRVFALPAVFPVENQLTLRCDYIDTRWQQREASVDALCDLIVTVYNRRPGKYLVFFPSYDYLNRCYQTFENAFSDYSTIVQNRGSSDEERQVFLDRFLSSEKSTIGFAILGGVFGEGVDFAGDALTGAIVIGTGMPQPSPEQKLIEAHFVERGLNGFQFAYQFPGFTRVKQTAGRVIRSETDRGIVVLVDPRFKRRDYQQLMPTHWKVEPIKNSAQLENRLAEFWAEG